MEYREAGVDINEADSFIKDISSLIDTTHTSQVVKNDNGFAGLYRNKSKDSILVSSTDGVGTKLKIANYLNIHNTIGIDLVAMCVNDVLTTGAAPLFFMDYIATGKLNKEQLSQVIEGIVEGCLIADCALIGGETAEMPSMYKSNEYDLAGFCLGEVQANNLITKENVRNNDALIGLASSGLHSNGFSIINKYLEKDIHLFNKSFLRSLLTPTRIYTNEVLTFIKNGGRINGMAHITGGGLSNNIPRMMKINSGACINKSSWRVPSMFNILQEEIEIEESEMFNIFNMGIGFVLAIPFNNIVDTIDYFHRNSINAFHIGNVINADNEVFYY